MSNKNKGCRALHDVQVDFSNTCAGYGAAQYRMVTLAKDIQKLKERLDEITLELKAAEEQESSKPKLVVEETAPLETQEIASIH